MRYSFFNSKYLGNVIFIAVFAFLFYFFGLHKTLFYPAQSVHIWRQTNCLSLTQNYYQHDLPFFSPEMHNQFPNDGESGKSVGEFPIIYFSVAKLWKIFGKQEWIFKLVQNAIFFLGLFALFAGLRRVLKNQFWAGFISLLIFTSPMIVFFGPNFLPDVPALSFVFMAWYFVIKFLDQRKTINLWLTAALFCLACLLKITSAISVFALGGWVVFELIFLKKEQKIFRFRTRHFLPFFIAVIPVLLWYWYVDHYNSSHGGHFSFHGIWPIWDMDKDHFIRVIDILDKIYFKEMFLPATQFLTFAIWLFLILTFRRRTPIGRYVILVLPLGFLSQLLLWFQVLDAHDYYMINLLVVLVAIWGLLANELIKIKGFVKYLVGGIAVLFFYFNVVSCKERAEGRYIGWMNDDYQKLKALLEIEPFFKEIGVKEYDKVISVNDFSINGSLYYMNRKGYTNFGSDLSKSEIIYKRIDQGAKFLVVTDTMIVSKSHLKPFIQNPLGNYENVHVYDLINLQTSKSNESQ